MSSFRIVLASGLLAALLALPASAGVAHFKNGDQLSGKIVEMSKGKLKIKSAVAGEVTVNMADVESLTTDGAVKVHLKDGRVMEAPLTQSAPGAAMVGEGDEAFSVALSDMQGINPPPPKPPVAWTGDITGGATFTRGNSHTDSAAGSISMVRRTASDRLMLDGQWLLSREKDGTTHDKDTTKNYFYGEAKYDYFLTKTRYVYGRGRGERDQPADLNFRGIAGAGMGYQWLNTDRLSLSTDMGPAYMYEEYKDGGEGAATGQASYRFEAKLNDRVRFLHSLTWNHSLRDLADFLVNSKAELRVKLTKAWFVSGQVHFTHDQRPADDADRNDVTYLLALGLNLF